MLVSSAANFGSAQPWESQMGVYVDMIDIGPKASTDDDVRSQSELSAGELNVSGQMSPGLKTFPCENCDKIFTDPSNLQRHIRANHAGARSHACSECGKTFATSSGLKQHQHIHSSVKPFQCEVCLKSYTQFSNLCRHKRMHADCRQQIKCSDCQQAFSTMTSLSKHKRFCEGVLRSGARFGLPPTMGDGKPLSMVGGPHTGLSAAYMNFYGHARPPFPFYPPLGPGFPVFPPGHPAMAGMAPHLAAHPPKIPFSPLGMGYPGVDSKPKDGPGSDGTDMSDLSEGSDGEHSDIEVEKERKDMDLMSRGELDPSGSPIPLAESTPKPKEKSDLVIDVEGKCDRDIEVDVDKESEDIKVEDIKREDTKHEVKSEEPKQPAKAHTGSGPTLDSAKPSSGEQPLDLSVRIKEPELDEVEDIDESSLRKTHIFGSNLPSPRASPNKILRPSPQMPKPATSEHSPAEKSLPIFPGFHSMQSPYLMEQLKEKMAMQQSMLEASHKMALHHSMAEAQRNMALRLGHNMAAGHKMAMDPKMALQSGMNPLALQQSMADATHKMAMQASMAADPTHMMSLSAPRIPMPYLSGYYGRDLKMPHHMNPTGKLDLSLGPGAGLQRLKERYACKFCGKVFPRSANLTRHLRTHTGEQPYKCRYCERSFSISSNLQRHVRNIHNKEKPFRCPLCDRCFGQQTNLDRHLKKHETEGPHPVDSPPPQTEDVTESSSHLEDKEDSYFSEIRNFIARAPDTSENREEEERVTSSKDFDTSPAKEYDANFSITSQIGRQTAFPTSDVPEKIAFDKDDSESGPPSKKICVDNNNEEDDEVARVTSLANNYDDDEEINLCDVPNGVTVVMPLACST